MRNQTPEERAFGRILTAALDEELQVVTGSRTETEGHNAGRTLRYIEISYYEEA